MIPHRLPAFLGSLMPLKNLCSINARCSRSSLKHSIRFCVVFPSLKQNFIAYRSSSVSSRPDCIFEIHQLWQSVFSRVYSNCCCSCSFEAKIIKICQSYHKMYNIVNFQESTTILNASTKSLETYWRHHVCVYVYIGCVTKMYSGWILKSFGFKISIKDMKTYKWLSYLYNKTESSENSLCNIENSHWTIISENTCFISSI